MNTPRTMLRTALAVSALVCLATGGIAEDDSFALITQRNIFDPSRRPAAPAVVTVAAPPPAPTVQRESLVLTGSLVYPGKQVAFFSGSDPSYNAICSPRDRIGAFTVEDITTAHVVLAEGETRLVLPVGRQLQRQGDAPWEVATRSPATTPPISHPASSPAPTASPSVPGGMSEVMKRLLERRQQEITK